MAETDYDPKLREHLMKLIEEFPNDSILIIRVPDGENIQIVSDMFGCPQCMMPILMFMAEKWSNEPHTKEKKMMN